MCTGQRTTELRGFPLSPPQGLRLDKDFTQGAKLPLSLEGIFNDCYGVRTH